MREATKQGQGVEVDAFANYLAASPGMRTSTNPIVSLMIRRCAPWSIAMASTVSTPRPARWAISRPRG